ncbi:MAG: hypothetical protein ACLFPE_01050 [Bacteroidales bacterium]
MTKNELIEDAGKLKQPSGEAIREFSDRKEAMIGDLNERLFATAGFNHIITPELHDMLRDNHQNQFRFMESVFGAYNAEVFVNTVLWVFSVYRSHGFDTRYWDQLLPAVLNVYESHLSRQTYAELAPFYRWLNAKKHEFISMTNNAPKPQH